MALEGSPFPFKWSPENGARIGVMPRSGAAADVKWFTIDPCFVFHTWNAFHDAADDGMIHLDCVRYETMWTKGPSDFNASSVPTRFSIDTTKGTVTTAALGDLIVELPRINPLRQGLVNRYSYSVGWLLA